MDQEKMSVAMKGCEKKLEEVGRKLYEELKTAIDLCFEAMKKANFNKEGIRCLSIVLKTGRSKKNRRAKKKLRRMIKEGRFPNLMPFGRR